MLPNFFPEGGKLPEYNSVDASLWYVIAVHEFLQLTQAERPLTAPDRRTLTMHYRSLRESTAEIYLPWKQSYWQGSFAIRTTGNLARVLPALRRATAEVNPALTLWQADAMGNSYLVTGALLGMSGFLRSGAPVMAR